MKYVYSWITGDVTKKHNCTSQSLRCLHAASVLLIPKIKQLDVIWGCWSSLNAQLMVVSSHFWPFCSVRWPSVLADGAVSRPRSEHHLWRVGFLTFRWSEVKKDTVQDDGCECQIFWARQPFRGPATLMPYNPPVFFSNTPVHLISVLRETGNHCTHDDFSLEKKRLSCRFQGSRIEKWLFWLCPPRVKQQSL